MCIDSPEQLEGMRMIGGIVARALRTMREAVRPGVTTAEVDEVAGKELAGCGAEPAPSLVYGFPGASCISVNAEALHGVPSRKTTIRPGDFVKLDLTARKDGYVADAAISVGVPPCGDTARRLNNCAQRAFWRALFSARAGSRVSDIGRAIEQEARLWGFDVLREWCGHGVGRRIHEYPQIPNFDDRSNRAVLIEGMVITVEPVITAGIDLSFISPDGWTVMTGDGALAAHYEHTLVITRGAPLLVTAV